MFAAGFYVSPSNLRASLSWFPTINPLRMSVEVTMSEILRGMPLPCATNASSAAAASAPTAAGNIALPCPASGDDVLSLFGFHDDHTLQNVLILLALIVLCRLLAYRSLARKIQRHSRTALAPSPSPSSLAALTKSSSADSLSAPSAYPDSDTGSPDGSPNALGGGQARAAVEQLVEVALYVEPINEPNDSDAHLAPALDPFCAPTVSLQ